MIKKVILILFYFSLLHANKGLSQFFSPSDTLNKNRLYSTIGIESTGTIGSMILLNEIWYKQYPRTKFHLFNDGGDWLQMDKIGHAMTSYYIGYIGYEILNWTGLEKNKSILYGSALGLTYLTTLEVLDGYSTEWGFSIPDMISNTVGTGLFISQQFIWNEQRIKLKFSSHHTSIAQYRPNILGSTFMERILKDYNGQTYWLSANIHDFINKESIIPKWINIALGYGADGMTGGSENKCEYCNGDPICLDLNRNRQFYLSLDADLTKINWKRKFFKAVFGSFGFIKIPFPAIEISNQGAKFHLLYF